MYIHIYVYAQVFTYICMYIYTYIEDINTHIRTHMRAAKATPNTCTCLRALPHFTQDMIEWSHRRYLGALLRRETATMWETEEGVRPTQFQA